MVWPTWLHLFGFSPLCVFKCALKASALEEAQSHSLHLFDFFRALSNVSSNGLYVKMNSHIDCTYLTFLHCAFSNVSSNGLSERVQSHIGCICLAFLHCAFSNVSPICFSQKMHTHIGCTCMIFLLHYLCFSWEHLHLPHFQ